MQCLASFSCKKWKLLKTTSKGCPCWSAGQHCHWPGEPELRSVMWISGRLRCGGRGKESEICTHASTAPHEATEREGERLQLLRLLFQVEILAEVKVGLNAALLCLILHSLRYVNRCFAVSHPVILGEDFVDFCQFSKLWFEHNLKAEWINFLLIYGVLGSAEI